MRKKNSDTNPDWNTSDHTDTVSEHSRQLEAKLAPLVREVVEAAPRTRQDFEFLYGRIVTSVILRSGK